MSMAPAQLALEFEPPKPLEQPFWIRMGWHDRHPNFGHPSEYPPASELQPRMMPDARNFLPKKKGDRAAQLTKYIEHERARLAVFLESYEKVRTSNGTEGYQGGHHWLDWPCWMRRAESLHLQRNNITWMLDLIRAATEELAELEVA
jgi:hypothetical protein